MRFLAPFIALFLLSACVPQEQADIKMAKGCAAGVNALLSAQGKEIGDIKVQRYADEQAEGGLHRRITLEAVEQDGWLELDKTYRCLFAEDWGLFKSSHMAIMIQIEVDDAFYGKKNGSIQGSLEDFMKLSNTIEKAMGQ